MTKKISPYLYVLPAFIIYIALTIYPSLNTFIYSFTNYDGVAKLSELRFVGLENYIYLFTQDKGMEQAVSNNLIWLAIQLVLGNGLALFYAVLLNSKIRGANAYRAIIFTPVIVSSAAISFVWGYILDPQVGDLNKILMGLGFENLTKVWLGDPSTALFTIILVDIWKSVGFNLAILIAALQTIPAELYEAGIVDGTNRWQAFKSITFPMLLPTLGLISILTTNGTLRTFDMVYILTGGGPGYATEVIMTKLFSEAFTSYRMGYGSAMAMVLFVILVAVAFAQLKITEQKEIY